MIHILTAEVYNRIAAGEVVDRPYSVVKELVENAIDAGATEIKVEIEAGGKKLIRVTDNGGGISKDDLPRAFLPHATSKLQAASDLEKIHTLGFRGEAIASIASVSRMKILSKTAHGESYSLTSEGGQLGEVLPEGGVDGTCVTVENLFAHTPARLKFLKSDSQEESDVAGMISRFILSRPNIAFTYLVNGKTRYRSFGDGSDSAIAVVYGADILDKCYAIQAEKHGIKLYGYLGNPNFSKPNRSWQNFFVNGRYIVNQTLGAAVGNAYAAYLMKRQYPFYVLFLEVPTEIVDVNVHPNKADVRFQDNQIIYGVVYSIVSSVLDGNSRALEYMVKTPKMPTQTAQETPIAAPVAPAACTETRQERAPEMSYEQAKSELAFHVPQLEKPVPPVKLYEKNVLEVHSSGAARQSEDAFEANRQFLLDMERQSKQEKIDVNGFSFQGELFQTYLLYESGDVAYLIDQHAAHERILYDAFVKKVKERTVVSQPLLVPYVLNVNAAEFAFLESRLSILRELGFEIEEFGDASYKISAVPADLCGMKINDFFDEVLHSLDSLRAIRLEEIVKNKIASAACKAAVKGGERLTDEEARALLRRMDGDMGLKCPHGRPVAVKLKRTEIEKLFKRIV